MKFVVLRHSELGKKESDYYEKPVFCDTEEEAKGEVQKWYDFLAGHPCNGGAHVAQLVDTDDVLAPVKHDRWEEIVEPNAFDTYGRPCTYMRCTACGFKWTDKYAVKKYFKHCPNCGKKLDLEV